VERIFGAAAIAKSKSAPLVVEQVTFALPMGDEVLVRISGTGICHTDIAVIEQHLPVPMPIVLGHEGAGIVEQVGPDVTTLAVGDAVILSFASCGVCGSCGRHEPAYCRDFGLLNMSGRRADGSTPIDSADGPVAGAFFGQSSFANYSLVQERNAVKVESGLPLEILGPLGCGLQTGAGAVMRSLAVPAGSSLLVTGGGAVGLAAVMAAVIQGCTTIILSEPVAARRNLALELGATHVIDPVGVDLAAAVRAIAPDGTDFALDTTAHLPVIEAAIAALARRGTIGLVGVPVNPATGVSVNMIALVGQGITVRGICEGDSDPQTFLPELIDHYRRGAFPIDRLVTKYPMSAINTAIADQKAGHCIKPVLIPDSVE
jgi:aryl-alcohol dehydrogenase